jgi:FkbM family methyltransferase
MSTAPSAAPAPTLRLRLLQRIFVSESIERDDEELDRRLGALRPRSVSRLARLAAWNRPLTPYPGWYPGIDEAYPMRDDVRLRLGIWRYFNAGGLSVPTRLRWHLGLRVDAYLGNDLTRFFYVGGSLDPNEFFFLKGLLQPRMTFLDVGANDGLYSLFASRLVGADGLVVAIEPSSRELARLTSNVRLNRLGNVTILPVGASDRHATLALRIADFEHAGQNTFGDFAHEVTSGNGVEDVPVEPLDAIVQRLDLRRIDVLKLDIEGAEYAALVGAEETLRLHRPLILIELFDASLRKQGRTANDVLALLADLGYQTYIFDPETGRPRKARPEIGGSDNVLAAHPERPMGLPE